MKKFLVTSALVGSAALFATAASAAPTVTVGGHADFQAGITDQDAGYEGNSRDLNLRNDYELHFNVEGKADNGLTYGATVELEADVNDDSDGEGDNADKTYVYVEGGFGRVELGANSSAAQTMRVDASSIARATGGIDGDFYHNVNIDGIVDGAGNAVPFIYQAGLTTEQAKTSESSDAEDANKITYYSARHSGVQLGVSYTPDTGAVGTAEGFSGEKDDAQYENVWNIGLNYNGQYNDVSVAAAATYEAGDSENDDREDLASYNLGLSLAVRGFSLAGSYADLDDSAQVKGSNTEAEYWTVGAAYEQGPAGISVTYLDSESNDNELTNVVVGVDYQLAPGFVPYVEAAFFDFDPKDATIAANDGSVFLIGTELTF